MKTQSISKLGGNTMRNLLVAMLILPLAFTACKKEEQSADPVTEEEAVAVATQAITPETGGIILQTNATLILSVTNLSSANCGVKKDTTITGQLSNNTHAYAYNLNWSRTLTCNANVASSYAHTFIGNSSYTSPKMSSTDQSKGNITIAGLEPSNTALTVTLGYERNGSQNSKVGKERNFTSKVLITGTGIKINKLSRQITSGSGTLGITGVTSTGTSFSYNGTITFNGNNKATLVVTGGGTYNLQW
ncbi:MAG: hypothetical protein V4594_20610 [Bacteroidota bacterium]